MQPKNNPAPQPAADDNSSRFVSVPSRNEQSSLSMPDREAAAGIARRQIDRLYETNPPNQLQNTATAVTQQPANPYGRSHNTNALSNAGNADIWKHYHSSWQNYYQQYYERYYLQQLQQISQKSSHSATDKNTNKSPEPAPKQVEYTTKDATKQIHDELIASVQRQAKKARHSVHFMPVITAITVGLLFMFIQYNQLFSAQVKAYVSPASSTQQSIILDPTIDTKVGPEPKIIIPKINVDAPVVYGVGSLEENVIQTALRDGVVQYPLPGANSVPGQAGNTVLLGHSSNDVFDSGKYKFVFVLLERLEKGDTFYVNYQGTRYTYRITNKEVVNPNEIGKLVISTDRPLATLVTCVPPGTALKRLLVYAEQISPDPTKATAAPASEPGNTKVTIPGDGKTLFERLFRRD